LRVRDQRRRIRPQPQHHHPQLGVAEVFLRRRHGDAALDVRLDDAYEASLRVDVHEGDVGKLPGRSLPRAINADVGAPPRETRMSPL
jgi:hypothetical protein